MRWMLQREALVAPVPHPTVRQFRTAQGLPLWLCAGTGEAAVEAPPPCAPCRGGFVCDEPVSRRPCVPAFVCTWLISGAFQAKKRSRQVAAACVLCRTSGETL